MLALAATIPFLGMGGNPEALPDQSVRISLSGRLMNGGVPLEGAALYLEAMPGVLDTPPMDPVAIDQEHLQFLPGSIAITPGTQVLFRNSDPVMHNIFSPGPEPFDLGTHARGQVVSHEFRSVGIHVMLCNIHPEMVAYVNVVPSPLFAVADDRGEFLLPEVPAGDYTLHVWVPRRRTRHSVPVRVDPEAPASLDLVITRGSLRIR
jgi:plastocyanin